MNKWLDLDEAQSQLLDLVPRMGTQEIAIEDALGRVLGKQLSARRTQPPADLSAMDGYAIAGAGPWALKGESRCGAPFAGTLEEGGAIRISTGAHIPQGSESVLMQENALRDGDTISATEAPVSGRHIRRRGFDFEAGDPLLEAGTIMGPAQIALALAGGYARLPSVKRPSVAILDSGDELSADPENCEAHQIPASNGAMIAAMIAPLVGKARRIGPVGDELDALVEALGRAEDCDILITTGGASVGDHDLVQEALRLWGANIAFWKVAIKPGKPLMVAKREAEGRRQLVLGLPGNPVSSFVTAFLFALPAIRASLGLRAPFPKAVMQLAGEAFPASGPRREFVRGVSDGMSAVSAASQDSSALASLAQANCLIERPANASAIEKGGRMPVYSLQNGGFPGV